MKALKDVVFACPEKVAGRARAGIARAIHRRCGTNDDFYDSPKQCWSKAALKYELSVLNGMTRDELRSLCGGPLIAAEAAIGLISSGMRLVKGKFVSRKP